MHRGLCMKEYWCKTICSIGFACIVAFGFMLAVPPLMFANLTSFFSLQTTLVLSASCLTLGIVSRFADRFDALPVLYLALGSTLLCCFGTASAVSPELNKAVRLVFALLGSVGFSLCFVIWMKMLTVSLFSSSGRVFSLSVMLALLISTAVTLMVNEARIVLVAVLPFMSLCCLMYYRNQIDSSNELAFYRRRQSKESLSIPVGARLSTATTSLVWVCGLLLVSYGTSGLFQFAILSMLAMFIGSIYKLIDSYCNNILQEERNLNSFAARNIFAFVLALLFPDYLCIPCGMWVLANLTSDNVTCLYAISEATRFNKYSPFWRIGASLSFYMFGIMPPVVIAAFVQASSADSELALSYLCAFSIIVLSIAGSTVFRNTYCPQEEPGTLIPIEDEDNSAESTIKIIAEQHALTPRQVEVLEMLVKGRNASYIADSYFISKSTAKSHISNIYFKLNVHSQQELISFVESQKDTE